MNKIKQMIFNYTNATNAKVGDECVCGGCGTKFIKNSYQQKFCKTKPKTQCKDKYWNNVTPNKRNNTTRISPASAAYLERTTPNRRRYTEEEYQIINGVAYDDYGEPVYNVNDFDNDHAFSSEGLGQW